MAGARTNPEFPAEASISKIEGNGQTILTIVSVSTTQRVIQEEKIWKLLREKETLLKEIHHRVKNNLQLISSLLGLQARGISDPDLRIRFLESQQRVHSMALVHETLYQSENFVKIDVAKYIRKLAEHLFRSYDGMGTRIRLRTDLDRISLAPDYVVPCGLIVNELVSNALKYAFPGGLEGEICIGLHAEPNNMAKLTIADTGIGLPGGVDWNGVQSLGFRLVHSLAKQLRATVEVYSHIGTEFRITFPSATQEQQGSVEIGSGEAVYQRGSREEVALEVLVAAAFPLPLFQTATAPSGSNNQLRRNSGATHGRSWSGEHGDPERCRLVKIDADATSAC